MIKIGRLLATLLSLASIEGRAAGVTGGRLHIDGAELVLTLHDGRTLRGGDLAGVTMVLSDGGSQAAVKIERFVIDLTLLGEPLPTYHLTVVGESGGRSHELCMPDPKGRRVAVAYPADDHGGFHLTCTSGAEGKCLLLGYRPWLRREGVPMRDLFKTCIHMLRADYGGDNRPATRNGTLVHLYDRFGIQKPSHADGMAFEAAWGPEGALCVAHPRFTDLTSLEELGRRYPRLQGRLGPEACSEEAMRADPRALIINESVAAARPAP